MNTGFSTLLSTRNHIEEDEIYIIHNIAKNLIDYKLKIGMGYNTIKNLTNMVKEHFVDIEFQNLQNIRFYKTMVKGERVVFN